MLTITVLKSIGHVFARMASRLHIKEWQRRLSGRELQRPIQGNPYARNGLRQCPHFLVAALVGAMIMLTPCCAQALTYNWATTGVDGAALSGTSNSAIGAATALSVAALPHGGCASATETGFVVTSDTGLPGGSWSVSFMYSDTVTETNTIVGSPCYTGGPEPFSVGGTITGTGLQKDVGNASDQDAVVGDPIVLSIGNKVQTDTDYQAPGPNPLQFVRVYNSASIAGVAANFAALTYNWAVTGVDGAALSGTSNSAIGAAMALSVAALAHGGCASATETGFAVTSDTGLPGGSWSVSFMYSDTVTETNTITGTNCKTGGPIGPFSVGGTITSTWLPKGATGWMHNYALSVNTISTTSVAVTRPDGKVFTFNLVSGSWTADADISDRLVQLLAGSTVIGWQYTNADNDSLETYDAHGNLSSIAYREGTGVTMTYATGSGAPTFPGQLLSVTDSFGKSLTFGYVNNILHTMTDPNGGVYTYTLGPAGTDLLSSVTYPDTYSESYLYNESAYTGGLNLPTALTGVIDANNSRYTTTWYGTGGAAIQTGFAGGVGQYSISNSFDASGRIQSVGVSSPLGASLGRTFVSSVGRNRVSTVTQPADNGAPAATKSYTYDVNGNVASITDLNGNLRCSVYDLTRNLETGRVEGMAPGSTCPTNISTYVPATGTVERKTLTQWHSIWHLPASRAEPLKITTWVYNGDGGVYCAPTTAKVGINPIGVVCSRSEQATTDATGGAGFGATASGAPRVWSYTYNSYGQVLTAKGPRTDVNSTTTYTYYTCTTGAQCGQVQTVADAVGNVTTFNTYNAFGRPLTITDPNGVVTTLTYDARQRLTSLQVGTETTGYSYWPTGLLETVTQSDSSTVSYTYDAAHRLTKIADGAGNYISYTLDAAGNRTADNSYDPSGTLHRTHTRVFNALGELYQDINAAGTAAVTTTLGYDAQGNQTSVAAPLSRNTSNAYDALNRLAQITDPNSGITKFAYDAKDNLTSVIDPRTLTTSYSRDGFGDVTQLVSPDTGATNNTYDSGGNLATATDARGAEATYSYDPLNRVTKIAYSDQTLVFGYDTGTNGKGRLTGASDANHSLAWAYDALGRITGKGQTIGTITKSAGYAYTNGDMTSLVTPSGQTVTFGYTNHRITSIAVNGAALLNAVTYDPFGPATGWTWGNATAVSRAFDEDGNPHQIITAGVTNGYTVDNASRITGISDSGLSSDTWMFGYDLLDRVNSGTSSAKRRGYTYDANSNRLTTTGTTASTETVSTTDNQLKSTSGGLVRTYAYDAAGNTKSYTGSSFTFNQRGRMSAATVGSTSASYIYSALGQMIKKTVGSTTTLLMYDEAGHILGEYSSTGALIEETIWLGDIPVATLRPSGSTVAMYYVHTDHLGTPRKVTRPSDNALMWRWDPDTFGSVVANSDPSGYGTFTYYLAFPGQYYQRETGLYLNYFRDYDPQTGRYLESDPIGFGGGSLSTYSYAGNNPIFNIDPLGLESGAAMAALSRAEGFQPPGPPGYISPEVKSYLCKLINECEGDFACVFNRANADRRGGTPANPTTWNDPTLRNAENFATAAAPGTGPYPYEYTAHSQAAILFYQHVVKPDIYPLINKATTPVSGDALAAGMAGSYWHSKSAADALNWCNECSK